VRPDWQATDPEHTAARESATYGLLAGTGIPAPELLAADIDGNESDVPSLLFTRAPGRRIESAEEISRLVRPLAEAIHRLHDSATPNAAQTLLPYRPFCEPAMVAVPAWAAHPDFWQRARELADVPSHDASTFIHRDFHPGNTLRVGDAVSAIVDWTTASWGPPAVVLCHMRVNLALSAGLEVAEAFLEAYRSVSGSDPLDPLWDLRMAVDFVPDLRAERMTARELARLDEFVLSALAAL
jgi:aminoglycoside phosphotransferase (APT) family kinase protein